MRYLGASEGEMQRAAEHDSTSGPDRAERSPRGALEENL